MLVGNQSQRQQGFTLIELLLALTLAGVVVTLAGRTAVAAILMFIPFK